MRMNLGADKHLSLVVTRRICRFMLERLSIFLKIDGLIGQTPAPNSANDYFGRAQSRPIPVEAQRFDGNTDNCATEGEDTQSGRGLGGHAKVAMSPAPAPKITVAPKESMPFQERPQAGNLLGADVEPALVADAACVFAPDLLTFEFMITGRNSFNVSLARDLGLGLHSLLNAVAGHAHWFVTINVMNNPVETSLEDDFPKEYKPSSTYH